MADAVAMPSEVQHFEVGDSLVASLGFTSEYYDSGNMRRITLFIECVAGAVTLQVRDSDEENWGPAAVETWGTGNYVYNLEASCQWRVVATDEAKVYARKEQF